MNESPAFKEKPRRSLWLFGLESEQPTLQQRQERAAELSVELGTETVSYTHLTLPTNREV